MHRPRPHQRRNARRGLDSVDAGGGVLTMGSLFSGIGGLELGLEWAGLGPTLWQVEQESFCRAVLEKHWPQAERFDDVCAVGSANLAPVQLICGGFPCQDVSSAGKGAGLAGERSGLWREFARVVGELRPEWVVVENVTSGASRWLDAVVRELERLGYEALPVPVSARDVGAPHIRARLFIVAHSHSCGLREQPGWSRGTLGPAGPEPGNAGASWSVAHADGIDRQPRRGSRKRTAAEQSVAGLCASNAPDAHDPRREGPGPGEQGEGRPGPASHPGWASESGMVPLVHGLSGGLAGRRRRARIRALGNAVVPQCAEVVGWVIRELMAERGTA